MSVYHLDTYGGIVALVCDGEEFAAAHCGEAWPEACALVGPDDSMGRAEAVRLSVLLYALEHARAEEAAGIVDRWRALAPADAYWLGRKAESSPAWRRAIGIAIGEDVARVG